MMSWKLMAAAIKAQRTWANLSPEQKANVGKAAQKAAVGTYGHFNRQKPRAQAAPAAPAAQPAPGAPVAAAPQPPQQPQPTGDASTNTTDAPTAAASTTHAAQADAPQAGAPQADPPPPDEGQPAQGATPPAGERSDTASTAAAAAANAVILARAHGPRLARQAASSAATHSRNKASQLYGMWRRSQGPQPK